MPDISDDDLEADAFELSLDEMLERVSAATRAEWEARGAAETTPAKRAPRPPLPPRASVETAAPAATPDRGIAHRVAWPLLALSAVGIGLAWSSHRHGPYEASPVAYERLPPPAAGRPVPASAATRAPVEHAPALQVIVDADASTEALMIDQLNGAGGASAKAAPASGLATGFAIARYDTLQSASSDWRVVAPLNVEEVYVLVPVTSRLRDLDDLRGRRINIGARGSARATSGEALYRRLFAQPLPASPLCWVSKDAALRALLDGDGLDALAFFDGQPSAWLESLPGETRGRLKVLSLQATSAAGRKALQACLPATIAPTLANDRTPVATLGEVAFLVASPQAIRPEQTLQDLCERLPALRAHGHPAWREVDPSVQLPLSVRRAARSCFTRAWIPRWCMARDKAPRTRSRTTRRRTAAPGTAARRSPSRACGPSRRARVETSRSYHRASSACSQPGREPAMKKRFAVLLGCGVLLTALSARADVKLVMFRHAEKPVAGLGQLSCQGLNRALALPRVLLATYGRPAAMYAPNPGAAKDDEGVSYNYLRPLATLEPTAIQAGLPVNTTWAWNDIADLQTELLNPSHEGQTLYVAWEHNQLELLARSILKARGGDPAVVRKWHGSDFDGIYVMTLKTHGGATFTREAEGLDNQSVECPGK